MSTVYLAESLEGEGFQSTTDRPRAPSVPRRSSVPHTRDLRIRVLSPSFLVGRREVGYEPSPVGTGAGLSSGPELRLPEVVENEGRRSVDPGVGNLVMGSSNLILRHYDCEGVSRK